MKGRHIMAKVTTKHNDRKDCERLFAIDEMLAQLTAERKAIVERLTNEVFSEQTLIDCHISKTAYKAVTIQRNGEPVYILHKRTTAKGRVNSKALYADYKITDAVLDGYRGKDIVTTSIEVASENQLKKLGLL